MIKLGVNSVLFRDYDFATAVKYIAECVYDGVEISAIKGMCEHLDLDRYESPVDQIKEWAEQYGLELLAMEEAALDEERLQRAYEAAAALGIPVINVGPGGKSDVEEDFERQLDRLERMAEKARDYGVVLCAKAHVGQSIYNTPKPAELICCMARSVVGVL